MRAQLGAVRPLEAHVAFLLAVEELLEIVAAVGVALAGLLRAATYLRGHKPAAR